jgi:hydroxyquinol 1,2-dioxygenase
VSNKYEHAQNTAKQGNRNRVILKEARDRGCSRQEAQENVDLSPSQKQISRQQTEYQLDRTQMTYPSEEKFTNAVLRRWEDIPDPRLRQVIQSAIKHLHAFVSEVRPTPDEWFEAIKFLTAVGQKCDDKRQEFILLSDIMGVSMLVDEINNRRVPGATPSTVEGPSHIANAPEFETGANMAHKAPGNPCFITGTVRGLDGQPIEGAMLDLWQTDGEGLYEEQRRITEPWMRGIYKTQSDGSYSVRTVAPISYSIPIDGPVGAFFNRTNMSHFVRRTSTS